MLHYHSIQKFAKTAVIAVLLTVGTTGFALSHDTHGASAEYTAAMKRMDEKMMAAEDVDPGKEYIKKMVAHHGGAIEMSEIALRYSKTAFVRATATKVISMQKKEMVELNAWLAAH